jgi:hypothetical protein
MRERFLHIVDTIIYHADWLSIFYVVCGVILLILFVRFLKISPLHAIVEVIGEITEIFGRHDQARARSMIDGILTVSGLIFTAIMAAPFVIEELYQLIGMFKLGVEHEHQPTYLFVLMFFTTCIATLISLQLTKGEKR